MNLDPTLTGVDRGASLIGGLGLIAYALLGDLDQTWVRALVVTLGVVLAIGGLGGT